MCQTSRRRISPESRDITPPSLPTLSPTASLSSLNYAQAVHGNNNTGPTSPVGSVPVPSSPTFPIVSPRSMVDPLGDNTASDLSLNGRVSFFINI